MITKKMVAVSDVGYKDGENSWKILEAIIGFNFDNAPEDMEDVSELEIVIGSTTISLQIQDLAEFFKYAGVDLNTWIES